MPSILTRFCRILASAFTILLTYPCVSLAGDDTPLIRYETPGGMKTLNFADGRLTAVHFWATWCVPCIAELPDVDAALQTYKDSGLQVIALSVDNGFDRVTTFYKNYNIRALAPVLDHEMEAFRALKIDGLPTTLFYNAQGKFLTRVDGPMHWGEWPNKDFIEEQLGVR